MSNIIDSIRLSGVTYGIKGSGGTQTIELTQAQYDALVDKDPNTFYVITDAQAGDLTQYWTSAQTQSAINQAVSGKASQTDLETVSGQVANKQDTLVSGTNIKTINNTSILGSGNITIQGGGGKAIEAGRGISITTGETADTVSFNLPISADSNTFINAGVGNTNSNTALNILIGSGNTAYNGNAATVSGGTTIGFGNTVGYIGRGSFNNSYSFAFGYGNGIQGGHSYTIGENNNIGRGTLSSKSRSFLIGYYNTCTFNGDSNDDYIFGKYCTVSKSDEFALGKYNVSNTGSTDADRTFFSIGNGTSNNARHNAFEIRQNGDIYLTKDGQDIKLQDQLGGGGSITIDSGITSGSTNAVENGAIWSATTYNKEVTLEFDNSSMHNSTNFPSGCTTVKVTVPNGTGYINVYFYSGSTNYTVGSASIQNYGTLSVSMNFTDASYTIDNNDVIITYPASKSVNKVGADNHLQGAIVKAVVEGAFVNENTYMSAEVDGKIKALDDKKLDATAYTPTVVDSQLNAASTNPVQNQALYDELVIEGAEEETTLTFSADTTYSIYKSTNYPNGCTKVKVVYPTNSGGVIYFNNGNNQLGYATIKNYGTPIVSLTFNGASYSIVDGVVVITYPTVVNVDNIRYSMYGTAPDSVEAVYTQTTHLIDQVTANTTALGGKQDTLVSGTNIKTINNESLLGSGNIDIQGGGSSYTAGDGIDITNDVISVTGKADTSAVTAIQDSLSGYVTTDTEQIISGRKIFTYSASSSKAIEFKQTNNSAKVGFRVRTSAETNNELASFEFRPNTFTVGGVQHPLLYFGHYRNTNTAAAGVPQTYIGFRQYDQPHAAAYHYLIPLPEKARAPFNLTTSFKDYYAPMGFKNGSTMITADDTGVVDLSSELGGLKLVKLTQAEYDALATKDNSTLYVIVN